MSKIFHTLFCFFVALLGGIFGSEILWPMFVEKPLLYQYNIEKPPIYLIEKKEIKKGKEIKEELEKLKLDKIEEVKYTVVAIKSKDKPAGSAFVLTSDGFLITLAELVLSGKIKVFLNNKFYDAKILQIEKKENLALLKIEEKNLKTVSLSNFEEVKLGQEIFLIGAIFQKEDKKIFNEGIVKSFNENEIQTNIFEKNDLRGSSLFDFKGNFLGLVTIDESGQVFAIPSWKIKSVFKF